MPANWTGETALFQDVDKVRVVTKVQVVIPTYLPGMGLVHLVGDLVGVPAGDPTTDVVISDDASNVSSDSVLRSVAEIPGVTVIRHHRNRGIARGLNEGLQAALDTDCEWLLTLDQDSRVPAGFVQELLDSVPNTLWSDSGSEPIGVIAPATVRDASGEIRYPTRYHGQVLVTEEVIQSGALWNVSALESIGGFDESLGIDAVDAAACLRLREQGYLVALAPHVTFDHNLGDSRQVTIFGRQVLVTNHSPARRASMVRNRLRLAPAEFKQSPTHAFRTLRRVGVNATLGALSGQDRWSKVKGSLSGLRPFKDNPKDR